MKTPTRIIALLAAAGLVPACSPAPVNVAQSSRDPSSPSAPEGVDPTVASAKATHRTSGESSGHEHGSPSPKEGVVYACPMHPEVTSNAPGVCPKCNMKLVPKK